MLLLYVKIFLELAPKTNLKGDASNNQNHLRPRTPLLENAQPKKGHQISGTTVNVGTVIPKLIIIQKGHSAHPSSNSGIFNLKKLFKTLKCQR